jgi:hypothetical protein
VKKKVKIKKKKKNKKKKKKSLGTTAIDNCAPDSAMELTTSHQRINAKARVWSQSGPCGTYDEQSDTTIGFSHSVSVFACL